MTHLGKSDSAASKLMWLVKRAQKNPEKRLKLGLNVQKGKQWQKFPFVVVFKKKQRHCNNFTNMQNGGGTRYPTFKQLDHREKMRNYEKEKSTNVVTVILPKAFFCLFVFWNIKSFQSCLVLHGLHFYKEKKNAFLLLCLFTRGFEVKASPSWNVI